MKDIFELTVKIRVDRDLIPGFGYKAEDWVKVIVHTLLQNSHYNTSYEELKAVVIRNGAPFIEASNASELDALLMVADLPISSIQAMDADEAAKALAALMKQESKTDQQNTSDD